MGHDSTESAAGGDGPGGPALAHAALLAAIVESSDDAIIGTTLDGAITSWNAAAERLYGYTAEEVVGRPVSLLLPPDRAGELPAALAQLARGERVAPVEAERVRKDGRRVAVAVGVSPVRDAAGRLVGAASIARDVGARRAAEAERGRLLAAERAARAEAEAAQARLALLAEAGEVLGASLDEEATLRRVARLVVPALADWCTVDLVDEAGGGRLRRLAAVHADPAKAALVARLADYPPASPAEHPVLTVMRTGRPTLTPDLSEAMLVATTRDAEHLALVRALGARSLMTVPLRGRAGVLGAINLVAADSGRRHGLDDLLLAGQVADRAALAIDNARLYREARAAVQLREEFLATASHELRTPLTSVKGYLQLLDRHLRGGDDYQQFARYIDPLNRQVSRLEQLLRDLLDVARVQQGRLELHPEPADLAHLARQAVAFAEQSPHRQPGHRLVVDAPAPVHGRWDAGRLEQVLTNLLSNALKYSPAGGEVRVTVRREGDAAVLAVGDEGMGIADDDRPALFQPFRRGGSRQRAIPGAGLGLYIVAQIVARHGGTIDVASQPGRGSTITVRLPLAPPAAAPVASR